MRTRTGWGEIKRKRLTAFGMKIIEEEKNGCVGGKWWR